MAYYHAYMRAERKKRAADAVKDAAEPNQAAAEPNQAAAEPNQAAAEPNQAGKSAASTNTRRTLGPAPKRRRKRRFDVEVQLQLRALPTFTPWFIYCMTFLQFSITVILIAIAYTKGNLAPMGYGTTYSTCSLSPPSSPPCPESFESSSAQTTNLLRPSYTNMWFGPSLPFLLSYGAKYAPCMRQDNNLNLRLAQQRAMECGFAPNLCLDGTYAQGKGYSCCSISGEV
jgi:hypothetical protein